MGLRTSLRKMLWKIDDRLKKGNGFDVVHYLHIGKSGGSSFKYALRGKDKKKKRVVFDDVVLYIHGHNVPMTQVPVGEKVIFFVRDPIKRFVSSFYERLRQGQPRVFFPWSAGEQEAFRHFQTPNALATALASGDDELRARAEAAMGAIDHVRSPLISWVGSIEYFQTRRDDVYFVGTQETLDQDFVVLKQMLKLPETTRLPSRDDINANPMPDKFDKYLSPEAEDNLRCWYARDYELIAVSKSMMPTTTA